MDVRKRLDEWHTCKQLHYIVYNQHFTGKTTMHICTYIYTYMTYIPCVYINVLLLRAIKILLNYKPLTLDHVPSTVDNISHSSYICCIRLKIFLVHCQCP